MSYTLHPEWSKGEHVYLDRKSKLIFVREVNRSRTRSGRLRPHLRVLRVYKVQNRQVWSQEKVRMITVRSVFCKIPYRENKGRDIHYIYSLSRFRELFEHCEPPDRVRV